MKVLNENIQDTKHFKTIRDLEKIILNKIKQSFLDFILNLINY